MRYDVFVSYSTKDKAAADAVCAALEANGVRCWVAPRDIKPGENWATSILRAIADCRMMVLVFSAHANASQHIRREVERAVHRGIPIAPLCIQDVMPKDDMEYFLSSSHWMDALTPPLQKHLREFTQKVRALLEVGGEPPGAVPDLSSAVAARQTAAASPRSRLAMLLGAVVLLASLIAAAWAFRGELARRFADAAQHEAVATGSPETRAPAILPASAPASAPAVSPPAAQPQAIPSEPEVIELSNDPKRVPEGRKGHQHVVAEQDVLETDWIDLPPGMVATFENFTNEPADQAALFFLGSLGE